MNTFLLTLLTGVVVGCIDIAPMIKMKLDRFSIISAFVFYLIAPFIVYSSSLFGNAAWWLKGGLTTLLLALPVVILVMKDGVKGGVPLVVMSVVLGVVIGAVGHYLLKVI